MEEKMGKTIASALGMQGWDKHNLYMFDFYFYLPDEVKAESLASELRAMGYKVEVQPSASDSTILCLGTKLLVPQEKAMDELGERFNALAGKYDGEFDGWEVGID